MAEMNGWVGKILRVNLTTGQITETPTDEYVPGLIGGRGIGAMVYWEEVSLKVDAFDPENTVIIMTGPSTGTLAPASSRFSITNKSPAPVKECYTFSVPGGHFGPHLKFAGYDGIIIKGKAAEPVYIWIHDGQAEIRSAKRLWGMTTRNTYLELNMLHGPKTRSLVIGPAGENLCREAIAGTDGCHATGIGGAGAVMGSKNLKAIAVNGTGAVKVARPQELIDLAWRYARLLTRKPGEAEYPATNKSVSYYMYHAAHLPYCPGHPKPPRDAATWFKNKGMDDPIALLAEPVKSGKLNLKWAGCYACPVCCLLAWQSHDSEIPSGAGKCNGMQSWPTYEWMEYKKVVGYPSIWFNRYIEDMGLSITNTCGYHFIWFFDLVKLGIITKENTGLPLDKPWTEEFIKGVLEMVAYRRGMGNALAEGQERFLKKMAEEHPETKHIYENVIWHPGYYVHWTSDWPTTGSAHTSAAGALIQATGVRTEPNRVTGNTGKAGDNRFSGMTPEKQREMMRAGNKKYFGAENAIDIQGEPKTWENKVRTAIICQDLSIAMDCVPMCGWSGSPPLYSRYTADKLGDAAQGAQMYSAVTGIETSQEDMLHAMDVIFNIERCILVREGRRREDDIYPDDLYKRDSWKWTSKAEFEKAMDDYYVARGWDPVTGIPRRSTLEKLGLKKIADELETKWGVDLTT